MIIKQQDSNSSDLILDNKKVEVLVIGGGPAGLLVAESVASRGVSCLLLEREQQIGVPVHTSGATDFRTIVDFDIPESLWHRIKHFRICSPSEVAVIDYLEPILCVIDVRGVYQYLAQRAQSKGATILTSTKAIEPVLDKDFVVGCKVIISSGEKIDISCKVLVDASGWGSEISKDAKLHSGFNRYGVGAEYELLAPMYDQDELVIIVGNRYAPSGYAWAFPWGDQRVRVGVGILHNDSRADPRDHLELFLHDANTFNVDLTDMEITEQHYGLVPSNGLASRFVGNGIMAVGDAAGQANLVVGEGIRLSMRAGQLAGSVAADAIECGKYDYHILKAYESTFRSIYGRKLAIGYGLNVLMASLTDKEWDDQIRFFSSMPTKLVTDIIQSEFPLLDVLSWIINRPRRWPQAIHYGLKILLNIMRRENR